MLRRTTVFVLFVLATMVAGASVVAAEDYHQQDDHEVPPIEIVQKLIAAGRLDEAEILLSGLEGDEAVLASFHGIIAMKRSRPAEAIPHFLRVLELRPNRIAVWLYLGQAYVETEQYKLAVDALYRGEPVGLKLPSYFRLRARAEQAAGWIEEAYDTLDYAVIHLPDHPELVREQALLLAREGLYAAALSKGEWYLALQPEDRDGYLILGEALRSSGRPREAAAILEQAALRFDQDPDVVARLALAHASDGRHLAAARLFARATRLGGEYAFEAADQFRATGRLREALEQNARVARPARRLAQRLDLYLATERFDRAAALHGPLEQSGALESGTPAYRLAYAHLRTGELDRAEALCKRVSDPDLQDSVRKLREAIRDQRGRSGVGGE